ncbi:MAG: DegV family protein [Clostridia bacterium]|nr:DegV family protein [Clostridia bacterium]
MIRLFTDSDCDVTPEFAAEYGYSLISMPYSVDEKTVHPYVDFDVFDDKAFYGSLRAGVMPTTSAISVEKYLEYFEPVFAAGDDILYVHFSAAMSATFVNMDKAVADLAEKYPERKFYAVDAKGISIVGLAVAREVGKMFRDGKSPEEILEWAKTGVDTWAVYFMADDLKFFKRSGRVSGLAATMGSLLGVRPIIHMNSEGKMVSIGKERGRQKALERLVAYVRELGDEPEKYEFLVAHSDAPEIAGQLIDMLKAELGDGIDAKLVKVNPTAGSHCGPDAVGVCFHAIHR